MGLKTFVRNMAKRVMYPNRYSSDAYIGYLNRGGAEIGSGTFFYDPVHVMIDEGNLPYIKIGKNCRITKDVIILGHDYSYAVLRPMYHRMLRKAAMTEIGNNVFIGMRAIILMGTHIGNNVIVGAGSVVSGSFPDNVVIAGNPAKVICTLEEYYQKNLKLFENYAKVTYQVKRKYLKREVTEEDMHWYNQLWKTDKAEEIYRGLHVDGDNKDEIISDLLKVIPQYESFDEFKKAISTLSCAEKT